MQPSQVDKKDLTSSDPYLKIARLLETGEQTYVFKTEVQKRTLNPVWKEIQVHRRVRVCAHAHGVERRGPKRCAAGSASGLVELFCPVCFVSSSACLAVRVRSGGDL